MGLTRVQNYNGATGLIGERELQAVRFEDADYLVRDVPNQDSSVLLAVTVNEAYRMVSNSTAIKITNQKTLERLSIARSEQLIDTVDREMSDNNVQKSIFESRD